MRMDATVARAAPALLTWLLDLSNRASPEQTTTAPLRADHSSQAVSTETPGLTKQQARRTPIHDDRSFLLRPSRLMKRESGARRRSGEQGAATSDAHEPDSDQPGLAATLPSYSVARSGAMAVRVRCREFGVRLKCSNFSGRASRVISYARCFAAIATTTGLVRRGQRRWPAPRGRGPRSRGC